MSTPQATYRAVYAEMVRWIEGGKSFDLRDLLAVIGHWHRAQAAAAQGPDPLQFCAAAARLDACVDHALDLGYAPVRHALLGRV